MQGYPQEFLTYLEYCRNLHFKEKPDYAWLKELFRELYSKTFGVAIKDSQCDWWMDSDDLVTGGSKGCTEEGIPTEEIDRSEEETSRPFYLNSKLKGSKGMKTSARKEIQCGITVWKVEEPKTALEEAIYKWKLEKPEVQNHLFNPEVKKRLKNLRSNGSFELILPVQSQRSKQKQKSKASEEISVDGRG